jgi:hypothetical protein
VVCALVGTLYVINLSGALNSPEFAAVENEGLLSRSSAVANSGAAVSRRNLSPPREKAKLFGQK